MDKSVYDSESSAGTGGQYLRLVEHHSHLNGLEYLLVHQQPLWREITGAIESVDTSQPPIGIFKERMTEHVISHSPEHLNDAVRQALADRGWKNPARFALNLSFDKKEARRSEREWFHSSDRNRLVKERIAVEIRFEDFIGIGLSLFANHMASFAGDIIDVGVVVVPIKEMRARMSTEASCYESEFHKLASQRRGLPAVPLILVGVTS